jgi:hypothetical protein
MNKNRVPFRSFSPALYEELEKELGTRPNSGFLAICDLLTFDIKELYITGFSFFKGGYYDQYRKKNEEQVMEFMGRAGNHTQEPQIRKFKEMLRSDSRIKTDGYLKKMMEEDNDY